MNAIDTLITREAREQRGLLVVIMLLAGASVCIFHAYALALYEPTWNFGVALVLALIGSWVLIAESYTREDGNDMGEQLAYLPLARAQVVSAKALWLLAVGCSLYCVLIVLEATYLWAFGSAWDGIQVTPSRRILWLGPITCWCVAISLWVRRRLIAVTLTLGAAAMFIRYVPGLEWLLLPQVVPGEWLFALFALLPLLAGYLNYRNGWLLPREGLLAGLRAVVCIGLLFGAIAIVQRQGKNLYYYPEAKPEEYRVTGGSLVGGDRYLSVSGSQQFRRQGGGAGPRFVNWILDVDSGEVVHWLGGWATPHCLNPSDGRILLASRLQEGGLWDLNTQTGDMELVGSSLHQYLETHRTNLDKVGKEVWEISYPQQGRTHRVTGKGILGLGNIPGTAYRRVGKTLIRHDLDQGTERTVYSGSKLGSQKSLTFRESPDGRVLFIQDDGRRSYISVENGETLAEVSSEWGEPFYTHGNDPFAMAYLKGIRRYNGNQGPTQALWVGPSGSRVVVLPRQGELRIAANGRKFLLARDILEIDEQARIVRMLHNYEGED